MNIQSISTRPAPVPLEQAQRLKQPTEQKEIQAKETAVQNTDIEKVVDSMNYFLEPSNSSLQFKLHEELGEYYVSIVDQLTNEVIREIPPKKLLDIHAAMKQFMGLIIDRRL